MKSQLLKQPAFLLMGALLVFLILCPLASIFIKAVTAEGRLDFSYAAAILSESKNAGMIRNSLLLGVLVVLTSTVIALPLAYLFSRTDFSRHTSFDILFLIPFMTPPYIASMGWILFMQKRGLLSQMVPGLPEGFSPFFTLGGLVLVMSLHIFPFMVTILKNAMENIPSSLEEAASVFGAGWTMQMRKILLPLLSGSYAIAALLVFVKTLSEYGTPYTLGRRIGFDVFTTDIHRYAAVAPISFGSAAVLASVLVTICLLLWMVQHRITARASYRLVSGKGQRLCLRSLHGLSSWCAWAYVGLILFLAIVIPYFSIITTSLIKLRGFGMAAGNFTLAHYSELFASDENDALAAMGNTFLTSLAAASICAALGTAIVLVIRRARRGGALMEAVSLLPEMLPGIVLVIGIMLFYNAIYAFLPLYNTMGILIVTYVILFLPFTVQYVTASFSQISTSLIEAARVLGASPFYIFRKITFPLLLKGIAAGWMMTFIISLRELVAPSLIAPPNTLVISTFIMREFEQGSVSLGMCMAVLCAAFTVAALLLLRRSVKGL